MTTSQTDATANIRTRIASIDIVRGLIMILMTLDHVRDFLMVPGPSPLNMKTTTVALFFTRWVTHFCAPTFVFLAGVSVFLASQRRSKPELRVFLMKRGLWLILSDLLIISFVFTFDPTYHILVLEVLWAIGFGMVVLALLIWLDPWKIALIGTVIFFGHNLLDYLTTQPAGAGGGTLTIFLTAAGSIIPLTATRYIVELYPVLPWAAALLIGYGFGQLFAGSFPQKKRRKLLLFSGLFLVVLFIVLRFINVYGDPAPWSTQRNAAHTLLSFLNATKQPPSLLYFSMTLGPVLIFLSLAEKLDGRIGSICRVYGNTPYFYFILHLFFIRTLNMILILTQGLPLKSQGFPLVWQAPNFGYGLGMIYVFWIFTLLVLYWPCKWYGKYKRSHTHWWLSYI